MFTKETIIHCFSRIPLIASLVILWIQMEFIVYNFLWTLPALIVFQRILHVMISSIFFPFNIVMKYQWGMGFLEFFMDWFNCDLRYRWFNGEIPDEVQSLESVVNNHERCGICFDEFCSDSHDDVVLRCGHRFHAHCTRKWEINHYCAKHAARVHEGRPEPPATMSVVHYCALCRASYQWNQKWLVHSAHKNASYYFDWCCFEFIPLIGCCTFLILVIEELDLERLSDLAPV